MREDGVGQPTVGKTGRSYDVETMMRSAAALRLDAPVRLREPYRRGRALSPGRGRFRLCNRPAASRRC